MSVIGFFGLLLFIIFLLFIDMISDFIFKKVDAFLFKKTKNKNDKFNVENKKD